MELLVAASLLAIGLLGYVALLAAALQVEREAANLATAATLASDLGERIRANRAGGLTYAIDPDAEPATPSNCAIGEPSDATARAACDLAEWRQDVADALPKAVVGVAASAVPGSTTVLYTIDVRWTAWRDDSGGHCVLQLQV